jgi:TRAP-type uncharacterized transport system substrate-binding protein
MRSGGLFGLLLAACLALQGPLAFAAERMRLVTGPESGLQPQLGRDFAGRVARATGIDLEVVPTAGPVDTLQRLREETGPRLALLQGDVAHAYLAAGARGHGEALRMLAPVRLIAPLHQEELVFIARSDSPLEAVHDIRDARINVGPMSSGSALSATNLYRLLFDAPPTEERISFLSHEEALAKLITDQSVDVVVLLAAQPVRLLANMKPEARRFVKLLRFDPAHASSAAALQVYETTSLRAASYPNLLAEDMPALASRVHLVAYGHRRGEADALLVRLARAWCQNLPRLKTDGHAKWRELEISLPPPGPGWYYAIPAARELARCATGNPAPPTAACGLQERLLGLCE